MTDRQLIFISHANPEDNEFASWLGTRLTAAGYDVWADVFRLVGGEAFWRDIGQAIKEDAAIVIVALSRNSYRKDGVLDEIALAVGTGRKLQKSSFVAPVRLDDLPFSEFPEQLIRLNAIDFAGNWADGLSRVLEVLQKAAVPQRQTELGTALDMWRQFRLRQTAAVTMNAETVLSNWFPITSLPSHVNFSRFNTSQDGMKKALQEFRTPTAPYMRLAGSFADTATLQLETSPQVALEHAYRIPLGDIIEGQRTGGPGITRQDGRNMVTSLLRQGWERFVEQRGLLKYEFSHGHAWFLPLGLVEGNIARFVDQEGKTRRRLLVGRSEKRNVYWHLAVSAKVMIAEPARLILRPHVVFTADGKTPLASKARSARLRKSFCKMWWNDRWRDLVRAFASFLAEENATFELPLGGDATATVAAKSITFVAPLSLPGDGSEPVDDDMITETEADALDDLEDIGADEDDDEDVQDDGGAAK